MKALNGKWKVEALGYARPFNLLADVKIIKDGRGYNIAKGKTWGHFTILRDGHKFCLDYYWPQNGKILSQVVDVIEARDPDLYEGIFYWRGIKVMRFRMIRVK
jgi:hypothetical protein